MESFPGKYLFFFFQYLNYEIWVITHQEQELVEKMEQQVYHVIT